MLQADLPTDSLHGLTANVYSLKTEKIPVGRLALDDWFGGVYWSVHLCLIGSEEACE